MIFNKINEALNKINYSLKDHEMYSLQLLTPLLQKTYVPFNTMSINPFNLAFILNEIVINDRQCIIEFGSGISTVYIAALIKHNNLGCKFYSVDHDSTWLKKISFFLENETLQNCVKLIHSPLSDNTNWYNSELISNTLDSSTLIDMVIIDGPPAYNQSIEESRYTALPYIFPKLNKNSFSIFLDDASRQGETIVLKKWQAEYKLNFKIYHNRLGVCMFGTHYESCPV